MSASLYPVSWAIFLESGGRARKVEKDSRGSGERKKEERRRRKEESRGRTTEETVS